MSIFSSVRRGVFVLSWGVAFLIASGERLSASVILPTGLPAGSKYEIIFGTSQETAATGGSIGAYNTFVTNSATPLTALLPAGVTWHAVVSTGASPNDAKDNAPSAAGIPIFNTQGIEVSPGNLYSGNSLLSQILYDENGALVSHSSGTDLIWTGTDGFGNVVSGSPIGSSQPEFGVIDSPTSSANGWITGNNNTPAIIPWPVYALSSPITVAPEPATLSLLVAAFLGLGTVCLARRRGKA